MTRLANRYLREMGVEVWVLRDRLSPAGRSPAPAGDAAESRREATPEPASSPARPASGPAPSRADAAPTPASDVKSPPEAADIPRFQLCFMHGEECSLVFSIPHDASGPPPQIQRFAADLLFALDGKTGQKISAVKWPMVQARHIDQSAQAAQVVVKQKLEQCAPLVLAFGPEAAKWTDAAATRPQVTLADIGSYIDDPLTKRELWRFMSLAVSGSKP